MRGSPRYSESIKEEARRLRSTGLSYREIGEALGVEGASTWAWCNAERAREHSRAANARLKEKEPERYAEMQREHKRKWNIEARAAVREARRRSKAISHGPGAGAAYELTSKLNDAIAKARAEATTREAKAVWDRAMAMRNELMDWVVQGVGLDG